jgi:hypothetical protein
VPTCDAIADHVLSLATTHACVRALHRVSPVVVERPRKEKATALFNFIPQVRQPHASALLDESQRLTREMLPYFRWRVTG